MGGINPPGAQSAQAGQELELHVVPSMTGSENAESPNCQRSKDISKRPNTQASTQSLEQTHNESPQLAKTVKLKLLSCCLCFLVAGLHDGSIGALIPYLIKDYGISTGFVGVVYAGSFAGWAVAALVMPFAKAYWGLKGTLLLGAGLYVLAQVLRVWVRQL